MALDQSALLELLEALKAAEVDDRIRTATETLYQALIEAVLLGAAWQRSSADMTTRRDVPVGHLRRRERTLAA